MYEIAPNKNPEFEFCYVYKAKNEAGQRICLEISLCEDDAFWVLFFITTKKRDGFQEDAITGKDGIKSLVWAKKCLLDFIAKYKRIFKGRRLNIGATDERRFNVYKNYLEPYGFREVLNGKRMLMLKL